MTQPRGRRWAFFGLAVVIGLTCLRLGFWQLDRLNQRRAANAAARARLELSPISLLQNTGRGEELGYRRAIVHGTFDPENEVFLTSRTQDGIAGVHVITPLLLDGGGPALLVDRGWIADEAYRSLPRESWTVQGPTEVAGFLLPSQSEPSIAFLADRVPAEGEPPLLEWRALSIPGIRRQMAYPILDVYLVQESPAPHPAAPRPSPELDLSDGPHLGYAIQWFAFAAIALVGGALWLRRTSRSKVA